MVRHGGSSVGSYLTDPTFPIPFYCASIVVTSTLRVNVHVTNGHDTSDSIMHTRQLPERTTARDACFAPEFDAF